MSDDNSDTPLDFPASKTEYYPELVENSVQNEKNLYVWQPEFLQLMEKFGCSPEVGTHLMKSLSLNQKILTKKTKGVSLFTPNFLLVWYYADATTAANQLAQTRPAGNFKIKLPALKSSSKPGTAAQQVAAAKPCRDSDTLVNKKTLAATTVAVNPKKRRVESGNNSNTNSDKDMTSKKKKPSKKKARLAPIGLPVTGNGLEQPQLPAKRKRGRPFKSIEEKAPKSIAAPGFNASVFVSIESAPKLMRRKTYKTDKHVAQEPHVEGPFTLIRSMKWVDFLHEVAGWVGVDKENLRVNGLSWGFQKQKAHLLLTSEQAFKTLREQVKVKNSSATVIFVYHPICKQLQNWGPQVSDAIVVVMHNPRLRRGCVTSHHITKSVTFVIFDWDNAIPQQLHHFLPFFLCNKFYFMYVMH